MRGQLTVRIPDELEAKLQRAARRERKKRSELVRLAIEQFLGGSQARRSTKPLDLVQDLVGAVASGIPDLGQRHREYLLNRLRHAR